MTKERGARGEQIASVSDGTLQIDLSDVDARQVMAIVVGQEQSPLDSGDYFLELEVGRIHRLSLAENPPPGDYTVVVVDRDDPGKPPWVSRIQIRDIRG